MVAKDSPDPRAHLEIELNNLAAQLRSHPTVPGDSTLQKPMPSVFDDKVAVLLHPNIVLSKAAIGT